MIINETNIIRFISKLPFLKKGFDGFVNEKVLNLSAKIKDFQTLTENLRQRLTDAEYKQKQTDRALASLMMARQLLDKTNNSLTDLCSYMEMGDAEALREMTESMEWSSTLLRIIKSHLQVLGRKNELENRLTIIGNKQEWDNPNFD